MDSQQSWYMTVVQLHSVRNIWSKTIQKETEMPTKTSKNIWSKTIQKETEMPTKTSKIRSKENQSTIPPEMPQDLATN
jgi:hypothetical protein